MLTFLLFLVFPGVLELIRKTLLHPLLKDDLQMLSYILYLSYGFIFGPIIYLYDLDEVQNKFRKFLDQIKGKV